MRGGLNGVRGRVERLASDIKAGCDGCRNVRPERIWCCVQSAGELPPDSAPDDAPETEECATCGRPIPISYTVVALSAADARL
jgi:hypothetical protein